MCATACKLWLAPHTSATIYSWTQNGDQCWCSPFAFPYPGVETAESNGCTMACPGDSAEHCGGGWTSYVVAIDCPSDVGWKFVFALALCAAVYIGGGLAHSKKVTGRAELPHRQSWTQLWGLVQDGVAYTRAGSAHQVGKAPAASGYVAASGVEKRADENADRETAKTKRKKSGKDGGKDKSSESAGGKRNKERVDTADASSQSARSKSGGRWVHVPV